MELPEWLTPHTVTVQTGAGAGAFGPTYADPDDTRAMVEYRRRRVRTAAGTTVVSSASVYLPLDAPEPSPGSLVTLPGESKPRAVVAATRHEFSEETPNHWEVNLE